MELKKERRKANKPAAGGAVKTRALEGLELIVEKWERELWRQLESEKAKLNTIVLSTTLAN